ncbi:MAG: dihydrodipicolinate synthase family protein [Bryobacteraceae bacterium]
MNSVLARAHLSGCYVTVPTLFADDDLAVNLAGIRRHVRFLLEGGLQTGNAVLLACGAAGGFSTMSMDERVQVTAAVIEEANGRIPVVMGAQTTSTRELATLARTAERLGAECIQVSPPFYFPATEDDFYEFVSTAADAADIGIVVYNTYTSSSAVARGLVERLVEVPNVIGLKWATPTSDFMEFEQVIVQFAHRLSIIDNQVRFVTSHILGARSIEVHVCNYWPQWGVALWNLLEGGRYREAQLELARVALPYYTLWLEMERYTSGDGYLDKLCMEFVGLDSSRCRPPTRDVRPHYRERVRRMLSECGVPGVA